MVARPPRGGNEEAPVVEPRGNFDVVALPGLSCDAAREAARCRHSWLENVFQALNDRRLAEWLDDEGEVRAFAASAQFVRDNAAEFSPLGLLPQVSPLARLPARELEPLREALGAAFERAFQPAEVARRLGARLDALLGEMRLRRSGDSTPDRLDLIRRAAGALHEELARLPDGFCVPPPGGGERDPSA